jgi:SAM-dependent methyltransferase
VDLAVNEQQESRNLARAALRGEPSYIWRAGQARRLEMILQAAQGRELGKVLVNGCGVGMYLEHLAVRGGLSHGLDIEFDHVQSAHRRKLSVLCGQGEFLPFPDQTFDLILSHEVLEHVKDDRGAIVEMVRTLRPGGRMVLFTPNRGYPFETHGIYWQGKYHFGNKPFVNYLPRRWRDQLAPHVRAYTGRDMASLLKGLPFRIVQRKIIFGAYDNIIARWPRFGRTLRSFIRRLEKTPFQHFGLSHFWVMEKI